MAQRTIHYLFGELLSQRVQLKEKKRFLLGSILPDAYTDVEQRDATHFKVRALDGIYLDFHKFLNDYDERIQEDDLYLGYYMHLVEDAFYRDFFYNQYSRMPESKEDVKRLHTDYHILNRYIVNKYDLKNELCGYENLYQGELERIAKFRVDSFLEELEQDFVEDISGETFYVTQQMMDEFVEQYLSIAMKELESVKKGSSCLNPTDYMWVKENRIITRVKEMEESFDTVQEMMKKEEWPIHEYEEILEKIQALKHYQESGQWLADFECDARGLLPSDLKRGVLSEDGLYNLLIDIDKVFSKYEEN